ncbi:hypothetical protein PVK06_041514 [Gossypium arboreum]|uniref:Uncharacterized protein n=1 Tax=Gossypium arboreum TaxID=29729 RepID=A0ABR0N9A4_GOSAR|nr:hypothetical protein PVK06_041514 [Gossypium arboreum]
MSTGEGTFYIAHNDGSDDESDKDPPREASPDGAEVALFFDPEPLPTIPEDVEGGSDDEEEDLRFRAYSPLAHMYNVDLSQDDALEFPDLPHRRRDCISSLLDLGKLEVGKEFSNKDSFLGASKQHSIMNGVNYNMLKSKSDKFEAKCVVQDSVSEDHPKMDLDMLATLILPTMKVLERYVPGCITDLETKPIYCNDRLLYGCQVFKHLFWSFKQYRDAFLYCKPLVQIDGIFMYGRYAHRLLLAMAQDGSGRILPIAFAITSRASADD